MSEWAFRRVEELTELFDEGIVVSFDSDGPCAGNLVDTWRTPKERERWSRPRWKIRIDCLEEKHRTNGNEPPWNTTFLEEQKGTFIHELLHWWRQKKELEPFNPMLSLSESQNKENEKIVDQAAFGIIKNQPALVDSIVLELSAHRGCSFRYECDTPFLQYHRSLVARYLKGIVVPRFGDERVIRLLRFMSANQNL